MPVEDGQEFGSYDPAQFRQPSAVQVHEAVTTLVDEDGNPLPSFDQRHAQEFEGLLYLGALTKTFSWLGHTFVIRTLSTDDLLAIPVVIKDWVGTVGESRALATAMAALAVISVDGQELPMPVGGSDPFAWAHQRFAYAKANWYSYTSDKVYSEYLALEATVNKVIEAMEKASGPTESTPGSNATSAGPSAKDS